MENVKQITSTWYLDLKPVQAWAYIEGFFSKDECEKIKEYGKSLQKIEAKVGVDQDSTARIDLEYRKNLVSWFNSGDPDLDWVYRKLTDAVIGVNKQFWNFDLTYIETLQYTMYDRNGDYYGPHLDMSFGGVHYRKLSFSLQLDDGSAYDGGDFKVITSKNPIETKRGQGDLILFPSFIMHEVTPITKGTRHSLVGWVCGPNFK
jgi:PKHD-type hydroxylase